MRVSAVAVVSDRPSSIMKPCPVLPNAVLSRMTLRMQPREKMKPCLPLCVGGVALHDEVVAEVVRVEAVLLVVGEGVARPVHALRLVGVGAEVVVGEQRVGDRALRLDRRSVGSGARDVGCGAPPGDTGAGARAEAEVLELAVVDVHPAADLQDERPAVASRRCPAPAAAGPTLEIRTAVSAVPVTVVVPREIRVAKPDGPLVSRTSGVWSSITSVAPTGTSRCASTAARRCAVTSEKAAGTQRAQLGERVGGLAGGERERRQRPHLGGARCGRVRAAGVRSACFATPRRGRAAVELRQRALSGCLRKRWVPQGGGRRCRLRRALVGQRRQRRGRGHEQGHTSAISSRRPLRMARTVRGSAGMAHRCGAGVGRGSRRNDDLALALHALGVGPGQPAVPVHRDGGPDLDGQRDPGDDERHQRDDRDVARVLPQVGQARAARARAPPR